MLIDGHVHFDRPDLHDKFMADMKHTGIEQFGVLMYEQQNTDPADFLLAAGFWLKMKHPDRCFLFGALDSAGLFNGGPAPEVPFTDQLQDLIDAGCDGLKILFGKPTTRKFYNHPIDGPAFKSLLDMLESTAFPVLWHIGDPPEFWSEQTVPLWARQNRWWYDESYPTKATIDREIANVLNAHPKLNIILPHFFFLSDRLEDAVKVLADHPNVYLDLAPGVEMYHNFTANHAAWREFFIKHADRIMFGSDIGLGGNTNGPERGPMIRRFLETDDRFQVPDDPFMTPDPRPDLHGLKLPAKSLEQICCRNYQRFVKAERPKPLNHKAAKSLLEKLETRQRRRGATKTLTSQVLEDMKRL